MKPLTLSRRTVLRGGAALAGASTLGLSPLHALSETASLNDLRANHLVAPMGLQSAPRLTWAFAKPIDNYTQAAYEIEAVNTHGSPLWNSGRVASAEPAAIFSGAILAPHTCVKWRVRVFDSSNTPTPWSEWATFQTGPRDWNNAIWIAHDDLLEGNMGRMPGAAGVTPDPPHLPAPYLRREFTLDQQIETAYLYLCGLGYGEAHINGAKVDATRERDPGFTNFSKRALYVTHDVTAQLKPGRNAIGVILGTGWYDVHDVATWHLQNAKWRERPRMTALLYLRFKDGSTQTIPSDDTWQSSTGPLLRDGIYTGEVYDARLEQDGWATPNFNASAWKKALVVEAPTTVLEPLACEPVRIIETLTPKSITQPRPGAYVVDMGQNFAGHARLRVTAPAGTSITMRYGEVLADDGSLNTQHIDHFMMISTPRQPFQEDTYITSGKGEEVWEQRFSYSGFRYVEVTGFPGTLTAAHMEGRVANTAMEAASQFTCSDAIVNAVHAATLWSYRSNAQTIPTDCPHREKNGWTGDVGLAAECGLTNFRSSAFYAQWLEEFRIAQRPDGGFPVLVPNGGWGNGEAWPGPLVYAWDAAYPILLWQNYRYTANATKLDKHLAALEKYVNYLVENQDANGLPHAVGLGDWVPFQTVTPLEFVNAAYQYLIFDLCARLAEAGNSPAFARRTADLRDRTQTAIQAHYYNAATRTYSNGSQCAHAMALHFGFCPASERAGVLAVLLADLDRQGHLDVGVLGAAVLFRALSENGRSDVAYKIAMQHSLPSYASWIDRGATTLWEGWRSPTSLNHIMFGDISAWFQNYLAGLAPAAPGWSQIDLRPNAVGGITSASCSYLAPRGKASIAWKLKGKTMLAEIEIPCGTTATLYPQEGARIVPTSLQRGAMKDGRLTLRSGTHRATIQLL